MEYEHTNLNGLTESKLPDIIPGTANEFIRVNNNATDYELTSTNIVPNPISSKLVLNSSNVNAYGWSGDPVANSFVATTGNAAGFRFDGVDTAITSQTLSTTIRNNGTDRITLSNAGGITFNGTCYTNDTGYCFTNSPNSGLFWQNSLTELRLNHALTTKMKIVAAKTTLTNPLEIDGAITQISTLGTNNFGNNTLTTTGNINGDKIALASLGTAGSPSVSIYTTNTGIYGNQTGELDFSCNGTRVFNMNSSRSTNMATFLLTRYFAMNPVIYTAAGTYNITSSIAPLIICQTPTSGTIDLELPTATSHFGGGVFNIINRAVGAGSTRYRAQSTTYHVTGGAAIVTIVANTYHTVVNDRFHILICNVDSASYYLIQT